MYFTECDSSNVVREINGNFPLSSLALIVAEVRILLSSVSGGTYRLISHCMNEVAHSLAISISSHARDRVWADSYPCFISAYVHFDLME